MIYTDLRDFISQLQGIGELKRVASPVSPFLEMTEVCDRVLRAGGPALLFEQPTGYTMPVLGNLFGTPRRVALGMGADDVSELRKIGHVLARLKEPEPPKGFKDMLGMGSLVKAVWDMSPKEVKGAPCHDIVWEGADVDLARLPIQHCWPGDAAPLITWGLVITKGPNKKRQNLGIYRQQVIGPNKVIMRWLAHRGGALDFREHAIGSELRVPASAEIVLEGHILPDPNHPSGYEHALEGPFGDHTGYYNEQDSFPVFTIERITMRRDPIYHSTYTGKPPDEPAVLGVALNEVFIPLLQKQFSEITDFYLPPEGCSYRMAVVQIKKSYAGHAKRVMFGVWSFLRQFMYTKFIVVVDEDVNIRDWKEVI